MAKILVFGIDNMSVGEITAVCNRGWSVQGSASTSSGASTTIMVSRDVLRKGWLQPGRMILVTDDKLPLWAGVVDMPIGLLAPAAVTLYNPEYLLSLRAPTVWNLRRVETLATIIGIFISMANSKSDLYVRPGIAQGPSELVAFAGKDTQIWEQMNALIKQYPAEIIFRPQRNITDGNRLYTYVDVLDRAGVDTGFLLHDGKNGNMKVTSATLDQQVWNSVIGTNNSQVASEKHFTFPNENMASINAFRARTKFVQFKASDYTMLNSQTQNYLNTYGAPIIKFNIQIMDRGDAFYNLAPGNGVLLHSSKINLPDGRRGWRGAARIMSMALNEKERTVGASLEAKYEF